MADGAVLVVDAVEGVMLMTERHIKLALDSGLKITVVGCVLYKLHCIRCVCTVQNALYTMFFSDIMFTLHNIYNIFIRTHHKL